MLFRSGIGRRVVALDQEPLGGLAPPGVGVGEEGDELGGRRPGSASAGACA